MEGRRLWHVLLVACVLLAASGAVLGLKSVVKIRKEVRPAVFLDRFMFTPGGTLNVTVEAVDKNEWSTLMTMGILVAVSDSNAGKFSLLSSKCPLDPAVTAQLDANYTALKFEAFTLPKASRKLFVEVPRTLHGVWSIHFVICGPLAQKYNLDVHLTMDNVDISGKVNYLSAGEIPLPWVYLWAGVGYSALFALLIRMMYSPQRTVNMLHWLMVALLFFKIISTLCESFMYFTMAHTGEPRGWNIAFYVFHTMRALFLFLIILMIGSGWQLVKAFISDRDRLMFLIVIPLQVAANIGLNICDENGIHNFWFYLFHTLDIVCCMLVLLPIIRNIEELQGKSDSDNKIKKMLDKLRRLRHFYILVVAYIYVTRVIGAVISFILPPGSTWVSNFIVELATFAFYVTAGYEFRPARDNTFFQAVDDDSTKASDA
jgi:hypothetical protein